MLIMLSARITQRYIIIAVHISPHLGEDFTKFYGLILEMIFERSSGIRHKLW